MCSWTGSVPVWNWLLRSGMEPAGCDWKWQNHLRRVTFRSPRLQPVTETGKTEGLRLLLPLLLTRVWHQSCPRKPPSQFLENHHQIPVLLCILLIYFLQVPQAYHSWLKKSLSGQGSVGKTSHLEYIRSKRIPLSIFSFQSIVCRACPICQTGWIPPQPLLPLHFLSVKFADTETWKMEV